MIFGHPFGDLKITLFDLNTMHIKPSYPYRDETPRIRCSKCGNLFNLGHGMNDDPTLVRIFQWHESLCEGNPARTLMLIEQMYKKDPQIFQRGPQ